MDLEKLFGRVCFDSDGGGGSGSGEPPVEQETAVTDEPTGEGNVDELTKELEELKKESAGKDARVTKLTKELEAMKKAQMTETEKKDAEAKERENKAQAERSAFLNDCRAVAAERAGLEEAEATLIAGSTQAEIRENGKKLQEALKAQYDAGYEKAKKEFMKTGTPQGGGGKEKTAKSLDNLFD